jgi:UDP-N-acetylglucosamine 2-epimerase (non-hydrolysing)
MFAPTASSKANLARESLHGRVIVTGNTVIDALNLTIARIDGDAALRAELDARFDFLNNALPVLLVTGHRRESFGEGFANICAALGDLAKTNAVQIVYPVHLNPNVRGPVQESLGAARNVHLIEPLDYLGFVRLMQRASIILTDSGGVQEEAPALGKPVLVMRDVTERPEAVSAGTVRLVGTQREVIVRAVTDLLEDARERDDFARRVIRTAMATRRSASSPHWPVDRSMNSAAWPPRRPGGFRWPLRRNNASAGGTADEVAAASGHSPQTPRTVTIFS